MSSLRLVFFGSGSFGLPTLERLRVEHDVVLVVSQPDRPAGRRRQLTPTPIAEAAAEAGLRVLKPDSPNTPASMEEIRSCECDAWVVIAYGHKLSQTLLADKFAINLHASLLPKYRGAAPINWAMVQGESETGVSVITLADRMDAGAVLGVQSTPIDPRETAGELHDRLAELGPELVSDTLRRFAGGWLEPQRQSEDEACPAPKLKKSDGTVRFDQPARDVRARVHGLTPWPGCTVRWPGGTLKLLRVRDDDAEGAGEPGDLTPDGRVTCDPGVVELLEVQPPGGRAMTFLAFACGHDLGETVRLEAM